MPARLQIATRLQIDRLMLNLPGGSAADGRRVGELVAANLDAANLDAIGALPQAGDLPDLRITVTAADRNPEALARRIADQILRALARSP